ncbi:MAG: regulatory protein RecX [Clostridiales bacterium]|nr:regulatory protein RecX [Clostridiales bacterium]
MRIEELQKRRGSLVRLVLDDGSSVLVDRRTMEESPFRVGSSFSAEELTSLLEQSRIRRAREKALYLLSMRDYSRAGLAKKLEPEAGKAVAEDTADRMEELGLLDDAGYAGRLARDLTDRRCFSRRRVRQELTARGIGRDIIDQTIEELDDGDAQRALELLRKKRYNELSDEPVRRRAAAALARAGFDWEDIRQAIDCRRRELEESGAGE